MKKVYWIAVYKDLKNPNNIKKYAEKASPAIKKYGGKILARGGRVETIEGAPSPRTVLIEFSNMKDALNCYKSNEYQEALKYSVNSSNRHVVLVEGL